MCYGLLLDLYSKYGNRKPTNEELGALLETIKSAMDEDIDNCDAVQDKFAAKITIDMFCKLTETILRQE